MGLGTLAEAHDGKSRFSGVRYLGLGTLAEAGDGKSWISGVKRVGLSTLAEAGDGKKRIAAVILYKPSQNPSKPPYHQHCLGNTFTLMDFTEPHSLHPLKKNGRILSASFYLGLGTWAYVNRLGLDFVYATRPTNAPQ